MDSIIKSCIDTLKKSEVLLSKLTNDVLSNASVSPYYSSIGTHIRHIYDFYDCALTVDDKGCFDLTSRERNLAVEQCCNTAHDYLNTIIKRLTALEFTNNEIITVIDDLGAGKVEISYTYPALLAQANSHTVHHYAIINYILDSLTIDLGLDDFGYNATTPKK